MMDYTEKQEFLYKEGIRLLKENGTVRTALLQRRLGIGYAAAREMIDRMLEDGVAILCKEHIVVFNAEGEKKLRAVSRKTTRCKKEVTDEI